VQVANSMKPSNWRQKRGNIDIPFALCFKAFGINCTKGGTFGVKSGVAQYLKAPVENT
jgi:hypothetical protein